MDGVVSIVQVLYVQGMLLQGYKPPGNPEESGKVTEI